MRAGPIALLVTGALCATGLGAPAAAQTGDDDPTLVPLVVAQSPTTETLVTGLTTLVRDGFHAGAFDGPDAAPEVVPDAFDFDVGDVGSGHVDPGLHFESGQLSATVGVTFTSANVDFTSEGDAKLEMQACPDERGRVNGTLKLTIDTPGDANGPVVVPAFADRDTKVEFRGRVDDRARLVSFDWNVFDDAGFWTTTTTGKGTVDGDRFEEKRRTKVFNVFESESPDDAKADGEANAVPLSGLVETALRGARDVWRNSGCVQLQVTDGDSATIDAGDKVDVVVAPASVDGNRLRVPIESAIAGFTSHTAATVQPARSESSPAEFVYQSSEKRGAKIEVDFRSVSSRGIGETHSTYRARGDYKLFGGSRFFYSGVKCDELGGTWTLQSDISGNNDKNGEDITIKIDPDTLTGTISGVRFVQEDPDAPVLEMPVGGTVRYIDDAENPVLQITRTGFDAGTERVDVTSGDFCTNGKPKPEEIVKIEGR